MAIDNFNEINKLVKSRKIEDAQIMLNEFCEKVKAKPNYAGYFWLAKSLYLIDKKKYASKIVENIDLSSQYLPELPNPEFQFPSLLLKARAHSHLKEFELAMKICDDIIAKKENGEAYYIRGIMKYEINNESETAIDDIKKADRMGYQEATNVLKYLK